MIATKLKSNSKDKKLKNKKTFKDKYEEPVWHVFNYENAGEVCFVIIGGDERLMPVQAYGDGEFDFNNIPDGLNEWIIGITENLEVKKANKEKPDKEHKEAWNSYRTAPIEDTDPISGEDCNEFISFTEITPLLQTNWGQGCWYNAECPNKGCTLLSCTGNPALDERTFTGCVATAMAQIINYYQYPSNYNYSILLPIYQRWDTNPTGAAQIANLMRDCGESVDMWYSCDGSSAFGWKIDNAFKNYFGYSSATRSDFNPSQVITDLTYGRPVLLEGFESTFSGHAWVCDGYREYRYACYTYLYLSMNWGWNGQSNAWYAVGDWSPNNGMGPYNHNKKMVYNIHP